MNEEPILQIENLKKQFGSIRAVDGISLEVGRGQIYGFLGPNGSGKTTTIGMILGLIHPSGGKITLFGQPLSPYKVEALNKVGAVVGAPSFVPYLSARKNLELIARLHPQLKNSRVNEILELVGISSAADRKSDTFSTGMKQRLGLGMALLGKPELLILDEPTNGMDPGGMHEVRNLLVSLADEGVTIFLSSHLLHEVEQICNQVAVMKEGKLVAEGEVEELIGKKTIVKVRVPSTSIAVRLLSALPSIQEVRANGTYVTAKGVSSQAVVSHLTLNGIIPSEVTNAQQDLESIFLGLIDSESKEI